MKRILALLLALVMVFAMAACSTKENKKPEEAPAEPEEAPIAELNMQAVLDDTEQAIVNGETQKLLELVHPDVLPTVLDFIGMTEEELNDTLEMLNDDMDSMLGMLDSYEINLLSEEPFAEGPLKELNSVYKALGVKIRAATAVQVELAATMNGIEGMRETYHLNMIEIDGQWYVDVFSLTDYVGSFAA